MLAPPSQGTCTLEGESNRGGGRNLTLGTSPPAGAFSACCSCTGFAAAPRGGAAAPPHHRPTASWAASAPPQRPARALAAPPRLHFAAAIHRCAAAPRASPEPLYGAMSRLGCRRGCAGAPPARRDATAAACVVSLTSPARASASQTRASPFPGAITGTAAAARAAPAAPPAPPGDAGRWPSVARHAASGSDSPRLRRCDFCAFSKAVGGIRPARPALVCPSVFPYTPGPGAVARCASRGRRGSENN